MRVSDIEKALDVLAWLSEQPDTDGELRDEIGHVRNALNDSIEFHS